MSKTNFPKYCHVKIIWNFHNYEVNFLTKLMPNVVLNNIKMPKSLSFFFCFFSDLICLFYIVTNMLISQYDDIVAYFISSIFISFYSLGKMKLINVWNLKN